MKTKYPPYYGLIFLLSLSMFSYGGAYGQEGKSRPRVTLSYSKLMPGTSLLTITAKYKGADGFEGAAGLGFDVSQLFENDSLALLGHTETDADGTAIFDLSRLDHYEPDSTGTYTLQVVSGKHPKFTKVEKSISYRDATLEARIIKEDSTNYITATLTDTFSGEPVADAPLKVQVQRLFRPLRIGEEFYMTEEDGHIEVPIDPEIPGLNGRLKLEVVLTDSDTYGNVKSALEAPLGEPIVNTSTFYQRTMWSPPSRTPLFLLIVPNLLILGIWGTLLYLVYNLFKIYKSKN